VQLATKLPVWLVEQESDWERFIDQQLIRLATDRIDFYMLHAWLVSPGTRSETCTDCAPWKHAKAEAASGTSAFVSWLA